MTALPTEKLVREASRPSIRIDEEIDGENDQEIDAAEPLAPDGRGDQLEDGLTAPKAPAAKASAAKVHDAGGRHSPRHDNSRHATAAAPHQDDVWGNRRDSRAPLPPLLAGIEVTLSVEIGSHHLPLAQLLSIDPGQIFALDRLTTEPVNVLVNGKPFARGEIVTVGDRYGVRLTEMEGQSSVEGLVE